ncbi:MAG: hypothetical protein ACLS7O_03030 [Faecalibacterium prausnitzii]
MFEYIGSDVHGHTAEKTDVRVDVPEQFLLFISRKIGAQWQMIFIENDLR